jgi:hypothetical protein
MITDDLEMADYIIGVKSHLKNNRKILEFAFTHEINILYLKQNNINEMNQILLNSKTFQIQ